jgi:hypothetical protein
MQNSMMNKIYKFLIISLLTACNTTKSIQKMNAYEAFKVILCGVFDNKNQVEAERKAGKQTHPFAKHITNLIDIKNKPADLKGYFILEESYYTYEGKPMEIKPLLFYIEEISKTQIRLSSYSLPTDMPKEKVTNANKDLVIDFGKISLSQKFKPATYQWNDFGGRNSEVGTPNPKYTEGGTFTVNHPNDLGNGMRFTLIETLTKNRLEVMELLEKDGKRLTPYDTPIIYERVKGQ